MSAYALNAGSIQCTRANPVRNRGGKRGYLVIHVDWVAGYGCPWCGLGAGGRIIH